MQTQPERAGQQVRSTEGASQARLAGLASDFQENSFFQEAYSWWGDGEVSSPHPPKQDYLSRSPFKILKKGGKRKETRGMIFISWGGISKGGGGKENSPNIAPLPGKKILNTPNLNSEYAIGVFLDLTISHYLKIIIDIVWSLY